MPDTTTSTATTDSTATATARPAATTDPTAAATTDSASAAAAGLNIVFVCGAANIGKSTYIAERFSEDEIFEIVDIYNFQDPVAYPYHMRLALRTYLSYMLAMSYLLDLIDAYKAVVKRAKVRGKLSLAPKARTIIVEGTFLKRIRREFFLESVLALLGPDDTTTCIWVQAEDEAQAKSVSSWTTAHAIMEVPDQTLEKFDKVEVVTVAKHELPQKVIDLVETRKKRDVISELDMLDRKSDFYELCGIDYAKGNVIDSHGLHERARTEAYKALGISKKVIEAATTACAGIRLPRS